MSTIEEKISELFAQAGSEGRLDIIRALEPFLPIESLINNLQSDPASLNDEVYRALMRKSFPPGSLSALFTWKPIEQPRIQRLLVDIALQSDEPARWEILAGLMRAGLGEHSLRVAQRLEDTDGFLQDVISNNRRFASGADAAFSFTLTGPAEKLDKAMLMAHEIIGYNVPGDFNGEYKSTGRDRVWNQARFEAQAEWVGETLERFDLGVPTARLVGNDIKFDNASLACAWLGEYETVHAGLGKWHEDYFPAHCPVLATPAVAVALEDRGGVILKPLYGEMAQSSYNPDVMIAKPDHGFSADGLERGDISIATALLPYAAVTAVRSENSDQVLVLMPYQAMKHMDIGNPGVPKELKTAMHFHRPEFLKSKAHQVYNNLPESMHATRLYLKGMPYHEQYHACQIANELADDYRLIDCFNSKIEIKWLQDYYALNKREWERNYFQLTLESTQGMDAKIDDYMTALAKLKEKIGFQPKIGVSAHMTGVSALAKRKPDVTAGCAISFRDDNGARLNSYPDGAIRARAELTPPSNLSELSVNELISTGVRQKDEKRILEVCGVLDRFDVVEVAESAKTAAQAKFVMTHFDLKSRLNELPKKFQLQVGRDMLSKDLGL